MPQHSFSLKYFVMAIFFTWRSISHLILYQKRYSMFTHFTYNLLLFGHKKDSCSIILLSLLWPSYSQTIPITTFQNWITESLIKITDLIFGNFVSLMFQKKILPTNFISQSTIVSASLQSIVHTSQANICWDVTFPKYQSRFFDYF